MSFCFANFLVSTYFFSFVRGTDFDVYFDNFRLKKFLVQASSHVADLIKSEITLEKTVSSRTVFVLSALFKIKFTIIFKTQVSFTAHNKN